MTAMVMIVETVRSTKVSRVMENRLSVNRRTELFGVLQLLRVEEAHEAALALLLGPTELLRFRRRRTRCAGEVSGIYTRIFEVVIARRIRRIRWVVR